MSKEAIAKEGSTSLKLFLIHLLQNGAFRKEREPEGIISGELKTQLQVEISISGDDIPSDFKDELDSIADIEVITFDFDDRIVYIDELGGEVTLVNATFIGKFYGRYRFIIRYEI